MATKIISAPASEPVSLSEAKLHCKIDHDVDDGLLAIFITAARLKAEHITGRVLVTQTLEMALCAFPSAQIMMPVAPVQSIVSIQYLDETGALLTLPAQSYSLENYALSNTIQLKAGAQWPATMVDANAVKIQFIAGYGDASLVPAGIKSWMLLTIESLYRNRGAVTDTQNYEIPNRFYDSLLDAYRIWSI